MEISRIKDHFVPHDTNFFLSQHHRNLLVNHDSRFSSSFPRLLRLTSIAICTIHLEAASYSSSTKEPDQIYMYNLGGYYLKEEKIDGTALQKTKENKYNHY